MESFISFFFMDMKVPVDLKPGWNDKDYAFTDYLLAI